MMHVEEAIKDSSINLSEVKTIHIPLKEKNEPVVAFECELNDLKDRNPSLDHRKIQRKATIENVHDDPQDKFARFRVISTTNEEGFSAARMSNEAKLSDYNLNYRRQTIKNIQMKGKEPPEGLRWWSLLWAFIIPSSICIIQFAFPTCLYGEVCTPYEHFGKLWTMCVSMAVSSVCCTNCAALILRMHVFHQRSTFTLFETALCASNGCIMMIFTYFILFLAFPDINTVPFQFHICWFGGANGVFGSLYAIIYFNYYKGKNEAYQDFVFWRVFYITIINCLVVFDILLYVCFTVGYYFLINTYGAENIICVGYSMMAMPLRFICTKIDVFVFSKLDQSLISVALLFMYILHGVFLSFLRGAASANIVALIMISISDFGAIGYSFLYLLTNKFRTWPSFCTYETEEDDFDDPGDISKAENVGLKEKTFSIVPKKLKRMKKNFTVDYNLHDTGMFTRINQLALEELTEVILPPMYLIICLTLYYMPNGSFICGIGSDDFQTVAMESIDQFLISYGIIILCEILTFLVVERLLRVVCRLNIDGAINSTMMLYYEWSVSMIAMNFTFILCTMYRPFGADFQMRFSWV